MEKTRAFSKFTPLIDKYTAFLFDCDGVFVIYKIKF